MTSAASTKPRCFVISPIGAEGSDIRKQADMVLHGIIEPALGDKFDVIRSDKFGAPEMITNNIVEALSTYELAVADLSLNNENVYYELGVRHAVAKPVLHIAQVGTKLPFDTAGVATMAYDVADIHSHKRAQAELVRMANLVMAPGYRVSNPVTTATGVLALAKSGDEKDAIIARTVEQVSLLSTKVENLTRLWVMGPQMPPPSQGLLGAFNVEDDFADRVGSIFDQPKAALSLKRTRDSKP